MRRTERVTSGGEEPRFEDITESTGSRVVPEAAQMLMTRYLLAAERGAGVRVLEIGCGGGQGLGLLARESSFVVGVDFSAPLLAVAKSHYGNRIPLVRVDAQSLPFRGNSFDVVLLFEAAYYIPNLHQALQEISSVLSTDGVCLIVSANPERPDFIPSPHSVRYHSARELASELSAVGLRPTSVQGAFPISAAKSPLAQLRASITQRARNFLLNLGLVPTTLKGRARLKRLIYPRQLCVPPELDESFAGPVERMDLTELNASHFKVMYLTAVK